MSITSFAIPKSTGINFRHSFAYGRFFSSVFKRVIELNSFFERNNLSEKRPKIRFNVLNDGSSHLWAHTTPVFVYSFKTMNNNKSAVIMHNMWCILFDFVRILIMQSYPKNSHSHYTFREQSMIFHFSENVEIFLLFSNP